MIEFDLSVLVFIKMIEEEVSYILERMRYLALSGINRRSIDQIRDSVRCTSDFCSAATILKSLSWIAQDYESLKKLAFVIKKDNNSFYANISEVVFYGQDHPLWSAEAPLATMHIESRLNSTLASCDESDTLDGVSICLDLSNDDIKRQFCAVVNDKNIRVDTMLPIVSQAWFDQIIDNLDRATAHHELLHTATRRMNSFGQ